MTKHLLKVNFVIFNTIIMLALYLGGFKLILKWASHYGAQSGPIQEI